MTKQLSRRRVNSNDVAELAQVSRSAVSRTFTSGASVAPDTRARVIAAATALGYHPPTRKTDAAKRAGGTVGVIMANLLSPYFAELCDRLNDELENKGLQALFFISSGPDRIDEVVQQALSRNVCGLILFSATPSPMSLAAARAAHVPMVVLNRNETVEDASLVWIDSPEVGRSVARLMLGEGRRRPVAVTIVPLQSREFETFAETMEAGGSAPCQWVETGWDYDDGLRAAAQISIENGLPDAIFALSDAVAIGLLDGMRSLHGADVPRDMSIVGFGNTAPSDWSLHRMSTVRLPILPLIQTAVSTLIARMASIDEPAPRIWLSCDVIERASSRGLTLS